MAIDTLELLDRLLLVDEFEALVLNYDVRGSLCERATLGRFVEARTGISFLEVLSTARQLSQYSI